MQLKLRRSQREGGVVSKTAIFCLDARADLTQHERRDLARYKLYDQVIYNSEAAKRHLDKSSVANDSGTASGFFKGAVHLAFAALRLNITIKSLERGHHIECKSLDELLAAEDAIMQACQNLRVFLDVAATFDGSEVVVDFSTGQPKPVAQAQRPEPILAPPLPSMLSPTPALALETAPSPAFQSYGPPPGHADPVEFADYGDEQRSAFARLIRFVAETTGSEEGAASMMVIGFGGIAIFLCGKLLVG